MLTYDDCLALCGLASEEVAAIARHEHLPEIVALEMGSCLCRTVEGRQVIRRMILENMVAAHERGDSRAEAGLQLVLRHFDERAFEQAVGPASLASGSESPSDDTDYAMRVLGLDSTTAPWVRERVEAYLGAMLWHFGLDCADLRARFPVELSTAQMRCASCAETARCRRFFAAVGERDAPSDFCPNTELFSNIRRRAAPSQRRGAERAKPAEMNLV